MWAQHSEDDGARALVRSSSSQSELGCRAGQPPQRQRHQTETAQRDTGQLRAGQRRSSAKKAPRSAPVCKSNPPRRYSSAPPRRVSSIIEGGPKNKAVFFILRVFKTSVAICMISVNPLDSRGNYSAASNNMKLVHWPLTGGL